MTRDAGRHKSTCSGKMQILDGLDDLKLVDSMRQRTTESQIVKRWPVHIECHKPGGVSSGFVVFTLVACRRNPK